MKKLIYLLVFSVFLGTQILAVDVGFKLSLYRVLFLTTFYLFMLMFINNDQRLRFYPLKLSSTYTSFYMLWLFYSLVSIAWSQNLAGWAKANIFIGIGVFSIIFIHLFIKEKKDLMNLFRSVAAGIILHIGLGLYELFTANYFWASDHFMTKYRPESRNVLSRIPISIYPNENDFATVMLMGSFILLLLARTTKNLYSKIGYSILWVTCFWLIYQTDSRANVLAFGLGIGAMVLAYFARVLTRKHFAVALGAAAGAGSIALIASSAARQQVAGLLEILSTDTFHGTSNEMRVNLIRNGFAFLRNSFGFGVGAGNIEHYMQTNAIFQTGGISNMHNWWMEILTGYGIVIFFLYMFMYISMIRKAYLYYRHSDDAFVRKTALAILGYLAAFTMSSISSASNIINEWQWVIFGVIIAFFSYCESVGLERRSNKIEQTVNDLVGGHHG